MATPPQFKVLRRPVESAQYVSIRYSERLAEAGIEPSVGSRGDSYDNALAETINGLYMAELIHRRTWKTRESVELATLEWVAWFNHHRLMEPLGYIPPAEAEANYYRQLETALSGCWVGHVRWRDEKIEIALSRAPFPGWCHQLRCSMVFPFPVESARHRGTALRARYNRDI